jgi:mannose-6-phosphate isomerase-like protein (cupin superfamily)
VPGGVRETGVAGRNRTPEQSDQKEMAKHDAINLQEKLATFGEQWAPKVIAELNDYQFKLVKVEGEFVWHSHETTDEAFIVLAGAMTIELRDGAVALAAGEMYVVPRGVEHRPRAEHECHVLVVEPRGVVNTGEAGGPQTADNDGWI